MGSDNIFKKRRAGRKERNKEFLSPKANSYLIVTEGTETEPNYFKAIEQKIKDKIGGTVNVVGLPEINIIGQGRATGVLITETEKIVKNAPIMYQNVWVVMDKDDFDDFDDAIDKGIDKGYNIAWSNQCFEYWLFLHFNYSDSDLNQTEWENKLNQMFRKYEIGDGKYSKNDEKIFEKVNTYCGVDNAIKNAKRRMANYREGIDKPGSYAPGTKVHVLVEELLSYLK